MANIWDYPIKYGYGNVAGYNGFHTGEDRPAPYGTAVTVNGVNIGGVGSTGYSTGNHLHVGKWKGGNHYNPSGRGKTITGATVTQVDTVGNSSNGKFVRVRDSSGYDWVYLHLSSVKVKVGQKLTGATPTPTYPKWVRVKSAGGANVRSAPRTSAPLSGSRYLPYGTPFRVKAKVVGENVNGNKYWYQTMYNNYVWTGNIT